MSPPGDESRWRSFMSATAGRPPWPELVRAAAMFDTPGDALDVGAGAGRDSEYLLEHGWRVTAVDSSPAAIEALGRLQRPSFRIVATAAQNLEPETYDLVNAQYSLPFVPRTEFARTVMRLRDAVRPGGVMSANFFGPRDEWNVAGTALSFSTREDVERLFAGWDIAELTEEDAVGGTADGGSKHWHVFHVTARRPRA